MKHIEIRSGACGLAIAVLVVGCGRDSAHSEASDHGKAMPSNAAMTSPAVTQAPAQVTEQPKPRVSFTPVLTANQGNLRGGTPPKTTDAEYAWTSLGTSGFRLGGQIPTGDKVANALKGLLSGHIVLARNMTLRVGIADVSIHNPQMGASFSGNVTCELIDNATTNVLSRGKQPFTSPGDEFGRDAFAAKAADLVLVWLNAPPQVSIISRASSQSDATQQANSELNPTFAAFCHHLNSSLEGTNRLDLSTAKSVVYSSFKWKEGADKQFDDKTAAAIMAAVGAQFGNKPGLFEVLTVGGQKRTFEFKSGGNIEEQGNGYAKWTILKSEDKETFRDSGGTQ